MRHLYFLIVFILFSSIPFSFCWGAKKDRIKLKDVTTLTLYHGQWTTGRRTRPVPQLQCIGGTAMCKFLPKTVQCYNRGSDGVDIQWECKADIPSNMRFNKIEVTCEGYDYPEDDYVLTGSCGLEYSLDTTDGTRPFPEPHFDRPDPRNIPKSRVNYNKKDEPGFFTVFVLGCISFCMWLIYKCCINPISGSSRRGSSSPPPSAPPPPPGFKTDFTNPSASTQRTGSADTSDTGRGFLPGLGIGALAGYLFAGRAGQQNNRHEQPAYTRTTRREYVHQDPPATEPSSWFNWFPSSTTRRRTTRHETTNQTSSYSSDTTSTPTTSTGEVSRNASGFGGTKRR